MSSRVVAEYDWVTLRTPWRRLHAPDRWDDPYETMHDPAGRTVCGRVGELSIPGLFSRLGLPRCRHCCRMTGMPQGKGSPKNSDACRGIVDRRLRTLGLPA